MIFVIIKKELKLLFASPLAWVLMAFLQGIFAWIFISRINFFITVQNQLIATPNAPGLTEITISPIYGIASILLLMSVPLLTMRLISEERRNKTITFLLSAPVSTTQIILGKFFSMIIFLLIINFLIFSMSFSLLPGGVVDYGLVFSNFLGLFFLGASFTSIGLFVSCNTNHPVVAAIISLAIALGLWIINIAAGDPESILNYFSLLAHYEPFINGVISLKNIIFFLLLICTFIILSIRRLEAERLQL